MPGRFPFAGIDVGGSSKGFHLVGLCDGDEITSFRASTPDQAVEKIKQWSTISVAIDAPISWAKDGKSRACERALEVSGIRCFKTPSRNLAGEKPFYDWVKHGLMLYDALRAAGYYSICKPEGLRQEKILMETFPHAIATRLQGARPRDLSKVVFRRAVLRCQEVDETALSNIDFVDAALCALIARLFFRGGMNDLDRPGGDHCGMLIPIRSSPPN